MLNTSPLSCLLIVFSSQFTRRRRWNASFITREKRFSDHVPTVCIRTTNWVRMQSAHSDIKIRDCSSPENFALEDKKCFPCFYKRRLVWLSSLQCSLQLLVIDLGNLKYLINLSYYSSGIAKAIICFNACTTNKLYWIAYQMPVAHWQSFVVNDFNCFNGCFPSNVDDDDDVELIVNWLHCNHDDLANWLIIWTILIVITCDM